MGSFETFVIIFFKAILFCFEDILFVALAESGVV
jgi:hypothetical protein